MVVVYTQDDEVMWCLDTSKRGNDGECPVVSFDITGSASAVQVADSFETFFNDYLEMHSE
jgi:hypothetical protein